MQCVQSAQDAKTNICQGVVGDTSVTIAARLSTDAHTELLLLAEGQSPLDACRRADRRAFSDRDAHAEYQ